MSQAERRVPGWIREIAAGYNQQLRRGYRAMIREAEANRDAALAAARKEREQATPKGSLRKMLEESKRLF